MQLKIDSERARTFFAKDNREELDPQRRASWDVGDLMRKIIDRLVDTRATATDLDLIAEQLQSVADRLGRFKHGRRYLGYSEASTVAISEHSPPLGHADFSPMLGRANPLAPPMEFTIEGSVLCSTVTFGHAYEGPPGHVHGGIVAAAFDELLGATQAMSGAPGMTGRLVINYRAPTPLHEPLRFESTLDSVDGRKITASGRLYSDDVLCAEAEGLFITVDFAKLANMRDQRDGTDGGTN